MAKYLRTSIFMTLLIFSLCTSVWAQNGAVKGKITDEFGLALPGAAIFLTELDNVGTASGVDGNFTILNVPTGRFTIQVTYIGYETITKEIEVVTSLTTEVNLSLKPGVVIGEEVLILGDRLKGQAKALNQQKNNANITNIVAADQIGRFPDANVGDAIKRIPGITMQYDQGEARDIIIRGIAPQLNSVTLNGERIPSAEGDNRRIQMDLIPADMIQTIEVNKAVTPDMDADAIGGSVNLVTRTATNGLRISGTAATGYNFLSEKPIWTGSVILGNRSANGKFGMVFSGSYNNHNFGSDNIEAVWVEDDNVGVILDEFDIRKYEVQRVRRSASLAFDYKINTNNSLFLSTMYNWRDDWENRYRYRVGKLSDAAEDRDITSLGNGRFQTLGRIGRQTKGGINNNRVDNRRLEDQRTSNVTFGGDHLIGNKLKLDWSTTYSRASEERPNERYIRYRESDIEVIMDISNPEKPLVTPVDPNSWRAIGFNEITEENQFTKEEDINSRINFQLPISDKGILKFGLRQRSKSKERDNNFFSYEPVDEDAFGASLGAVPSIDQSDADYLNGNQYQISYFADRDFLGNLDLKNASLFEESDEPGEYVPGNYQADENILGGYIMTDYQISSKLSAVIGVRLEHTNIDYKGFSFDVDNDIVTPTSGEDSYTNVLPGVHLKYDISENTIVKLAWTNTLARPNYFDLVPFAEFSPDDEELVRGNPALQPTKSMNFDLMAENYFKSIGLISAGAFYKDIDDFIYERVIENFNDPVYGSDLEFTTPENGGTAEVYGFEIAFQRQLDFLPGFWKGFGVYFNYTNTQSSTEGVQGREGEDLPLTGTAENMLNASLSYESEKLVLRASLNFTSDYLDELGGEAFDDRFYDKQTFLDINGSYAFKPNWRVFFELNNLTNQPLRYYQGISERTMQEEFYNVRMNLGVKFDLFRGN
ncbi:TonB-dependent receptor [Fulvivirgaceae bacterium BMA10]|uniref:TonB-dependent receptor n=1 Tax=Splendidivirga corallicola TaxID=3051826 RepID=A0ABT8KHZ9_9BACT|nr:TonB-dependent receptor [Fulvivirgaceae bacterium BMA10]